MTFTSIAPQKVNHFAILQSFFFCTDFENFSFLIILSFNDHSPISPFTDFENFSAMIILLLVMQGKTAVNHEETQVVCVNMSRHVI